MTRTPTSHPILPSPASSSLEPVGVSGTMRTQTLQQSLHQLHLHLIFLANRSHPTLEAMCLTLNESLQWSCSVTYHPQDSLNPPTRHLQIPTCPALLLSCHTFTIHLASHTPLTLDSYPPSTLHQAPCMVDSWVHHFRGGFPIIYYLYIVCTVRFRLYLSVSLSARCAHTCNTSKAKN